MTKPPRPGDRRDFEIAVICALRSEADAVKVLFDKFWEDDEHRYGKAPGDPNAYTMGVIGDHNVVLAFMPGMGKGNAASVLSSFRSSFPGIRLGLVVSICGGVPSGTDDEREILLGDVIISEGLVQYDFGRQLPDGFVRKNTLNDSLGRPNMEIRSILARMKGKRGRRQLKDNTVQYIAVLCSTPDFEKARYPGAHEDKLFEPTYRHKHHDFSACTVCAKCKNKDDEVCEAALGSSCVQLRCDENKQITRDRLIKAKKVIEAAEEGIAVAKKKALEAQKPVIHFGMIASGDAVMKLGEDRDRIASREEVVAFEMEGAGVWDNFPTVVIKGVCDYADSHKNKQWQDLWVHYIVHVQEFCLCCSTLYRCL